MTEKDFLMLDGMSLSAQFIRLQGKSMLAPSYVVDGSVQIIYVARGSGQIEAIGADGLAGKSEMEEADVN
ncbi:hypothetical protein L2E82_39223 [Cichorium intybus]|uniref:Uncharacterized protein n=1 Tax=Cichorium intybus TaxID=13427 RepID=A0ACB9AHL5_CICIN|nr:hypothetical protein L2E82_39223 [Cichorium intybus]